MAKRTSSPTPLELAEIRRRTGEYGSADVDQKLRREVEEYEILLGEIERSRLDDGGAPPEKLLQWARAWVRMNSGAAPTFASRILNILARQNLPQPALRSVGGMAEAILYGDDDYHLDLRVEEVKAGWRLRGQVVSLHPNQDEERWKIRLLSPNEAPRKVSCDEFGEFVIDAVPPSRRLSLVAECDSCRLCLPKIEGPVEQKDPT